jgi:F-type H+-transporting ATPase subunit a
MAVDPIHQFQIIKLFTIGRIGGQDIAFTIRRLTCSFRWR